MCAHTTGGGRVAAWRLVSVAGLVVGLLVMWPGLGPAQEAAPGRVDSMPAERALQALRRAWFDEIEELTAITRALAVADDTYEFVARPNLPYVYDHFDPKRLAADRIDTVLIIDLKRKPLFWRRAGKGPNRGFPDAEAFLAQLPALAQSGAAGARSLAGAARLAHGASLVVALPIYPTSGSGEARGWLVTARALDATERRLYEERAHVSAELLDPAASGLPEGVEAALKRPLEPVTRVAGSDIRGLMSLPDLNGRPLRVFSVLLPRPIATVVPPAPGFFVRYRLWLALAAIIAAIACVAGAGWMVFRRRDPARARAPASMPPAVAMAPAPTGLVTPAPRAAESAPGVTVVAPAGSDIREESGLEVAFGLRPSEPPAVSTILTSAPPSVPPAIATAAAPIGSAATAPHAPESTPLVPGVVPTETDNREEPELDVTFDFRASQPTAAPAEVAIAPAAARGELHARLTQARAVIRYQPQIDVRTGRVGGVEALLCGTKSGADQPATVFAAELEAAGLGFELAEWWLQEACSTRRYWCRQMGDDFPVSVPVSGRVLDDPAFPALVRRILADNELSSRYLELEVPEAVLSGSAAARRALAEVHAAGVLVAIDGFDGSRSSLRSLTLVPITKLLIDPKLVREAGVGAPEAALFDAIIGASRGLGIIACATGVDVADLAVAVERHGCLLAQGAALGPLVDGDQFLALIRGTGVDTATLPPLQLDVGPAYGVVSNSRSKAAGGRYP